MVTIKHIAKMAEVTAATVSNVLNGKKGSASADKAAEIKEIAKRLGYRPNTFARRLQRGKSNCIGVITEDLTVFNTPHIVDGIERVCEDAGYEVVIENMRLFAKMGIDFSDIDKQQRLCMESIDSLIAKQVEGIVYVANHCRAITFFPHEINIPIVCTYCFPSDGLYPAILTDDEGAGRSITQALLRDGHKRIGAVCGPKDSYHTQKRLAGYYSALKETGIEADESIITYGEWVRLSGFDAAPHIIKEKCDAVFAFNDHIAGGIMDWCRDNGIKAGRDIAIFGFDNTEISTFYSPQISSVALPLHLMGERSAERVIAMTKGEDKGQRLELLPCRIYERESSRR